jgi:phosphatidylethanolamine-binding protein (PEBP) family uncharacterized protein
MSESNLITKGTNHRTTARGEHMARIRIDDLPVAENLTPEQEELILGAGLKSFRPSLEMLEVRDMPASLGFLTNLDFTNRVLTIQPLRPGDNTATVRINAADQVEVSRFGQTFNTNLTRGQVDRIVYEGQAGIDTFTNTTGIPGRFVNQQKGDQYITMPLTSRTFTDGGRLPDSSANPEARRGDQSIGGKNQLPPLAWVGEPPGTQSWALVGKDISVPESISSDRTFIHQILSNIPKTTREIRGTADGGLEGIDRSGTRTFYIAPGTSSAGETGARLEVDNGGPNPPNGVPHTYVYTLYALRTSNLEAPAGGWSSDPVQKARQMERAIQEQSINAAQIQGTLQADVRQGWNTRTNAWND